MRCACFLHACALAKNAPLVRFLNARAFAGFKSLYLLDQFGLILKKCVRIGQQFPVQDRNTMPIS